MSDSNTNTNTASDAQKSGHFDLHATGTAVLDTKGRGLREISVRRGPGFLAIDIYAQWGEKDQEGRDRTTKLDCKVTGGPAKLAIETLRPAIDAGKSVVVGFSVGDLATDLFEFKSGERAGQTGSVIKARLLKIRWAKVDGEVVDLPGVETTEPETVPLTVRGLGYLNRVMQFDNGSSANIAALHGSKDEVEYTYFQTKVLNGAEAPVEALSDAVKADDKVLVGFVATNPCVKTFEYKRGKKAGQTGAVLQANLTDITFASVNGEKVE